MCCKNGVSPKMPSELASEAVFVPNWSGPAEAVASSISEPAWARRTILTVAITFIAIFVLLPLVAVFTEALEQGIGVYLAAVTNPEARSAIRLTLLVASIAVPLNVIFGLTASWAITCYEF